MNNDVRNCDCEMSQHIWYCTCEKAPNVLMTSDKKAKECDATAAPLISEPLAPKNPLEDITECYVPCELEEADGYFSGIGDETNYKQTTPVKKITLPSPAVGGMRTYTTDEVWGMYAKDPNYATKSYSQFAKENGWKMIKEETLKEKTMKIIDIFNITANDDRKQWEFVPRIEGYTSYTVSYSEASTKADACISVWKAINKHNRLEETASPAVNSDDVWSELKEDVYGIDLTEKYMERLKNKYIIKLK